jgi:hypothetical protein
VNVIVDANIFKGYVMERILEINHALTGSPISIFEDSDVIICFDEKDQIKTEYVNLIKERMAVELIIEMLNEGKIRLTNYKIDEGVESALRSRGFDMDSRDKWYVRVALYAKSINDDKRIFLISEDIDFYDPTKKECSCEERNTIIRSKSSPVCKYLVKMAGISPICVETYNNIIA